jgi:anti-sigma regulatory factor (Ser/Thr protein kinase)
MFVGLGRGREPSPLFPDCGTATVGGAIDAGVRSVCVGRRAITDSADQRAIVDCVAEVPTSSPVVERRFVLEDLGSVRDAVRSAAATIGIGDDDLEKALIAVSEIATNAIRYAGGEGWLTVLCFTDGLRIEVRDRGSGLPDDVADRTPASPTAAGGRGLWLARSMVTRLDILSTPEGVTASVWIALSRVIGPGN